MGVLLVESDGQDLAVLAKELVLPKHFLVSDCRSDADDVDCILLDDLELAHCLRLVVRTELSRVRLARLLVAG